MYKGHQDAPPVLYLFTDRESDNYLGLFFVTVTPSARYVVSSLLSNYYSLCCRLDDANYSF